MNERSFELYSQILSQEGIGLEYSNSANTAYFDLNSRRVIVPTFDFLDEETTQFLVSHEVGHAKYSSYSQEDFERYVNRYGDLFNVIEDAHVENRMKKEFRGLNAIFLSAYSKLNKEDFFGVKKEDVASLGLVSRLNLHYKLGHLFDVPFNVAEEMKFALRLKTVSSKKDVLELAEDILSYLKEKRDSQQTLTKENLDEGSMDSEGSTTASDDSMDSEGSTAETDGSMDSEGSTTEMGSLHGDSQNVGETQSGGHSEESKDDEALTKDSIGRNYHKNLENYGKRNRALNSEVANTNVVLSSKVAFDNLIHYSDYYPAIKETQFYNSKKCVKLVSKVKELAKTASAVFQRKKKAEELRTTKNRRCGVVDCRKLARYNVTNNIFKNVRLLKEGQNHGIVVLVDFSGSMISYMRDTLLQACVLGEFCRMNDIPFVVLAFGVRNRQLLPTQTVMVIGNNEFFDIGSILFLDGENTFVHNKRTQHFMLGYTPTVDALLAATYYVDAFKRLGVDKTAVFLITDGYHSSEYCAADKSLHKLPLRCSSVVVDNVLYDVRKYIPHVRTKIIHNDWVVELLCLNLKKRYDSFVSISHIALFEQVRTKFYSETYKVFPSLLRAGEVPFYDNNGYLHENFIFLWKHGYYFDKKYNKKIPCQLNNDGIISYTFKENPFINQFQLLDQQSSSKKIDLTKNLKWYKRIKVFVNAFIEVFS